MQQLATPDFIKGIPEFSGDTNDLCEFIECADAAIQVINVSPEQVQPFWTRALKNKITERAKFVLKLYGNTLEWNEIRTYLLSHFSDRRDERTLYAQLVLLRQNNGPIDEFYRNILHIVSLLNTFAASGNLPAEAKQSVIESHQRT